MSTVAIIGTGKIGTRLAEQLILDGVCHTIFLWNRSPARLEGTLLSLQVWAGILGSRTRIGRLDWADHEAIDMFVIAVKENYDPRQLLKDEVPISGVPFDLRYVGIRKDVPLVREVCERINGYDGKVIVVTNPVDLVTSLVSNWLPSAQVAGLGVELDAARFAFLLSQQLRLPVSYHDCLLGGEHGAQLVPLRSIWSNMNRPSFKDALLNDYLARTAGLGFQIVENLGYTLQDGALVFSRQIAWLLQKSNQRHVAAVSIWNETAAIGLPVRFDGRALVAFDALAETEAQELRVARDHIAALRDALVTAKIS